MNAAEKSMNGALSRDAAGRLPRWWSGVPIFWRVQIVGWSVFAVVEVLTNRLLEYRFPVIVYRAVLVVGCFVLFSWGMRAFYASPRFRNRMSAQALGWVALLSLAGATVVGALLFGARELLGWVTRGRDALEDFALPLLHAFIVLAGWSLCYFWVHAELAEQAEHRHAERAEAEALRAELEELRLQLDPHFLFNALNGVAEEIPEHPAAALAMLRDLTAYLRHSLDGINHTVMTVEAEVAGLSAWLRVQQARFGERLKVALSVEPAATSRRIASFLLQPLVENAVKHGDRETGLHLAISIRVAGEGLLIEIENTGRLDQGGGRRRGRGIGLENVRRRLALHYPGRHKFSLGARGPDAVVAALSLEGEPCGS